MRTEADAIRTNQPDVTNIVWGKPDHCPVRNLSGRARRTTSRRTAGPRFCPQSTFAVDRSAASHLKIECRGSNRSALKPARLCTDEDRQCPKRKTRPGGTAGRVRPYGRLGWMGARAVYGFDGEGLPLPPALVAQGRPHVQTTLRFFTSRNYWLAGLPASPAADLSEALAAEGWFKPLLEARSCRSEVFSAAGVSGTALTGIAGGAPIADTAA
ncbi:MAG: hypothetical protein QOC84_2826 [Bradyrhizobium sp.]|jgi:hypothetical protein|nr:hypothetical protein [Bradyrhizobium sp.]